MALLSKKTSIPAMSDALPGRSTPIPLSGKHFVNGSQIKQPAVGGLEEAVFGLGCFWGVERKFWQIPDTELFPKPVQKPRPPAFLMVSRSDSSVIYAADGSRLG